MILWDVPWRQLVYMEQAISRRWRDEKRWQFAMAGHDPELLELPGDDADMGDVQRPEGVSRAQHVADRRSWRRFKQLDARTRQE